MLLRVVLFLIYFIQISSSVEIKIIPERIDVEYVNAKFGTMNLSINNGQNLYNGDIRLLCTVNRDIYKFTAQTFLQKGAQYYPISNKMKLGVCTTLRASKLYGYESIFKNGNITKCPLRQGYYYFKDFAPNEEKIPPFLPVGNYKVNVSFMKDNTYVAIIVWYGSIIKNS